MQQRAEGQIVAERPIRREDVGPDPTFADEGVAAHHLPDVEEADVVAVAQADDVQERLLLGGVGRDPGVGEAVGRHGRRPEAAAGGEQEGEK